MKAHLCPKKPFHEQVGITAGRRTCVQNKCFMVSDSGWLHSDFRTQKVLGCLSHECSVKENGPINILCEKTSHWPVLGCLSHKCSVKHNGPINILYEKTNDWPLLG